MMKDKNDIDHLWKQFIEKKATDEELDELFSYLRGEGQDEEMLARLNQFLQATSPVGEGEEEAFDEDYWRAKANELLTWSPAPIVAMPRSAKWWKYAAAVVLLIVGATIGYLQWSKQPQQPPVAKVETKKDTTNDILPGRNRAILKLADGTTIDLDSAANGALAQQGNTKIVKSANGKIEYNSAGKADELFYNTMSTPRGGQYQLTLPDGSQVWLNAASSITYPSAFAGNERKVTITGEAYFEVAKDAAKPFKVDVDGKSTVEVLGTHFNINSYTDENRIRTTLLEGSVKVTAGANSVTIRPGQQARIDANAELTTANAVNLDQVMAWKNGLFNFEGANLEQVMRQLSRWYDIEVVYEKGIPNLKFGGEVSRNMKLSNLLKVLERADVKFRIEEGRKLVVLP